MTDRAQANYEKLLPDYKSSLKDADPEFMEIFYNFNFDDVSCNSKLDERSRNLVTLATLITNQSAHAYQVILKGALHFLTPIEVKEVLYQSIPYIGLAKGYDFFRITNEILEEEGVTLPLESQSMTTRENRIEMGYQKQCEIFGEARMKATAENTVAGQEHIQTFLKGYCFGDFYTRTGLNNQDRELVTFAIIASLGGCENQLRGHTAGNLNVGNDKEKLVSVVTVLCPFIGFPRTLNALNIINEVCG